MFFLIKLSPKAIVTLPVPAVTITVASSTVAVPPSPPTISNADGQEQPGLQVGPYEIDDDLVLDCHVRGGGLVHIMYISELKM